MRIQADTDNSLVLPVMTLNGFELSRSGVSVRTIKYDNLRNNPAATVPYTQELCTSIEINRDSFGLYLKCFIALLGTLIWIFITLFICTYHRIDPLRLIPTALSALLPTSWWAPLCCRIRWKPVFWNLSIPAVF